MSKTKKFRLQPVLNLKSNLVDMLEVEFAQLKLAHQQEADKLLYLQQSWAQEMEKLGRQQSGLLNCEAIQRHQAYLQLLVELVAQQVLCVQERERQMENKRAELVKMIQDQKALEKLQEHHLVEQRQLLRHQEANMIDDIVTTRYGRER